jgi:drug/metabolite transporter (DMT)-like permease
VNCPPTLRTLQKKSGIATDPAVLTGVALGAAGAIAFSGKAVIVKLAYRYGVDAVTLIMYRMLFALPLFLLLSWWAGRGKPQLSMRDWKTIVGLGFCGYYLASFLDFAGLQYINASLERLILYLNPTIVLGLSVVLWKAKVTMRQWRALAVSYAGVLLVFGHDLSISGSHVAFGAALVFGSAVSYALYLIFSGKAVKAIGVFRLTGLASSAACFLCILQFFLLRPVSAASVAPPVVWLSILNATLCTFCPVLLVMMAIDRVGPGMTAQTSMIGPLSTIALSVALLGEPFTPWMAAGTALVLAGIALLAPWKVAAPVGE